MPFRKKIKRAFGSSFSSSSTAEYDQANPLSHGISKKQKKNLPKNMYKPGEPMPKPKYRGPWNQEHQDKLSAFSFGAAWRRKSSDLTIRSAKGTNSEYSPMGSKLPSRGPSRRGSAWSTFSLKGGKRAWGMGSREPSRQTVPQQRVDEDEMEDNDPANVGLSRRPTLEDAAPLTPPQDTPLLTNAPADIDTSFNGPAKEQMSNGHPEEYGLNGQAREINGTTRENQKPSLPDPTMTLSNEQLFTAEELANAMSKSTLRT